VQLAPTAYVVDDDESIRTLWRWLLESKGIAVRAFNCAAAFIEAYGRGDPGCLVLDVRMPGMSGPELQDYLRREAVEIPIVFVSAHGDVPTVVNALKGGAMDFIQKPFDYRDAVGTVLRALERDAQNRQQRARREELVGRLAALTARERAVMHLVIEGRMNKVIAQVLKISIRTVEFHRANVMEKMGTGSVATLVQLVELARRPGIPFAPPGAAALSAKARDLV
jgi:two-component system response regulator TtrR